MALTEGNRGPTEYWAHRLLGIFLGLAPARSLGLTILDMSGSLAAMASRYPSIRVHTTICGNMTLLRTNGHGWAGTIPRAITGFSLASGVLWGRRLREIFRRAAMGQALGPTEMATLGSSAAQAEISKGIGAI